jgi:cytochrome c peroxidase
MKKLLFILCCFSIGCEENIAPSDFEGVAYSPTPYALTVPKGWAQPEIPADNPMTVEGIELGKMLFYDPILSVDSSISCSSCHQIQGAFTDNVAVSTGVQNRKGKRSAMALVNMAFMNRGLFWDGRVKTLEAQALLPVEDHLEMAENWAVAEQKLRRHKYYPNLFRKAFGINKKEEITKELAAKAIAQFERNIISKDSKFDKFKQDPDNNPLSDDEFIGYQMFENTTPSLPDAQCGHCHTGSLITSNQYSNNGLQEAAELDFFADKGHGEFTKNKFDNGKFRITTLRNMGFSAPYMHNGSLATVEDVMTHYMSGGKYSPTKDPLIQQIKLNNIQKRQIIAFLKTFDDSTFLKNPAYQNPFK